MMRNVPPANPGMAASQNNCMVSNLKPICGMRTTTALIMNHVAKDRVKAMVVIVNVRQAILLPVSCQKTALSGSHFSSHVFMSVNAPGKVQAYSSAARGFLSAITTCHGRSR